MQSLTGAILILTAAVLFGSGAIANALLRGADRLEVMTAGNIALFGAVVLGIVGFIVLMDGLNSKRPRKRPDRQSASSPRGDADQQ